MFTKKVTSTPSSVTFGWKAVKDADYYVVYRKKKKKDSWKKIATVKASQKLEYTDKTKTLYFYSVRAYEKLSSKKTIKSAMSEAHYLRNMGKPKIREIKIGSFDRCVMLVSELKNTPSKYQLYCKVGEKGKWKRIETGYTGAYIGDRMEYNKNGAVSVKELKLNKTYYFKIRGFSQKGDLVQYGPFSDVKSVKLHYNPKVTVTLPKKEIEDSSLPVTIANKGSATLRVYADGSGIFEGEKNLKVFIVGSEGATAVNGKYIDIPAGKTVKVYFLGTSSNVDYTKQTIVLLKFRYNKSEYYSSYSYGGGKTFINN